MNQQCPKCGTAYAVSAGHVGRTFTCKNCSEALAVAATGVVLASSVASPPPPPKPSPARARKSRDDDDDRPMSLGDDRDDDDRPARRSRRYERRTGGDGLGDFLTFRKMIVPLIIQIIFWLLVIVVSVAGVIAGVALMNRKGGELMGVAVIVLGIPLYILLVRMYCELLIVIFRINDTLTDIKNVLSRKQDD